MQEKQFFTVFITWSHSIVHCPHFVMSVLQSQFHFHKTHPLLQAVLWHKSVVASWSSNPGTSSHCRWHTGLGIKRLGSDFLLSAVFSVGNPENIFTTKKISLYRSEIFYPTALVNVVQLLLQNGVQQMSWTYGREEMSPWKIFLYFRSPIAPSTLCLSQQSKGCMSCISHYCPTVQLHKTDRGKTAL